MNEESNITITRSELKALMSEAVDEALERAGLGGEKVELQRDMAHLRKWRTAVDKTTTTSFTAAIIVIISGLMGALWLGISTLLKVN